MQTNSNPAQSWGIISFLLPKPILQNEKKTMNRFLINAIFRYISPYQAILPYNLNWMARGRMATLITDAHLAPITVLDVGCRGGLPEELDPLRRIVHHIGFDADEKECERMNAQSHDLYRRDIFPVFVGGQNGDADFHQFSSRGESSGLLPDPRFAALFAGPNFVVDRTMRVKTTTLDSFFLSNPALSRPDMIKLDTQGTELSILKGAEACLKTASMVEVEVEFLPLYEGQALFEDVLAFMRSHGFELLFLNRVFQQRRAFTGWSKGQLTFGDALFARREDHLDAIDDEAVKKYIVLLLNYGYLDIAQSILEKRDFPAGVKDAFSKHLRRRIGRWPVNLLKRILIPQIDKAILLLLYARRHNSLRIDSDRSWPFR
ncbi:MAG: FkbM family methyltransferase [Desulfatitalea sp.]|nr:FkbM family methyltransferase [Desulfatitalea sp.]NNK01947.1 FkbM family methyltransferase [Desulfatitalea sp.]